MSEPKPAPRSKRYLFRRHKRGKWIGRILDADGVWRQRALAHDLSEAETYRAEIQRSEDMKRFGLAAAASQTQRIAPIVDAYLSEMRNGSKAKRAASKAHARNVEDAIRLFLRTLGVERVNEITVGAAIEARAKIAAPYFAGEAPKQRQVMRSTRTVNKIVGHFRAMLTWAMYVERIAANPLQRLKPLLESDATKARSRHALSIDESTRLLRAATEDDARCAAFGGPMAPVVRALIETGIRCGELFSITRQDVIKFGNGVGLRVRAEVAKNQRMRIVPIRAGLADAVRDLVARIPADSVDGSDLVFRSREGKPLASTNRTNLRRWFHRVLRAAKISRRTSDGKAIDLHALRHTFNTYLAEAGVSRDIRQLLMGHSDGSTNAIYVAQGRIVQPLLDAIAKLPDLDVPPAKSAAE